MNAIYALWIRELKRYARSHPRIMSSLAQSLLYFFVLGFALRPVFQSAGRGDYLEFIGPGIVGMAILFTSFLSGIGLLWDRQFGFLRETLVAPAYRAQIMLGRTLGGATSATVQGALVLGVCVLAGLRPSEPQLIIYALLVMVLIAVTFSALGTVVGSLMDDTESFQFVMNLLVMPIFFLSGALYPIDDLPPMLSLATRANPLTYGIDALRGVLIGSSHFDIGVGLLVLSGASIVFLAVGAWTFSRLEA